MTSNGTDARARAREAILPALIWNLHAMFGETHEKAAEAVLAALDAAGLKIVDRSDVEVIAAEYRGSRVVEHDEYRAAMTALLASDASAEPDR